MKEDSNYFGFSFCFYLFKINVIWCNKLISLANNGRMHASSNGIQLPVGVVIVNHMEETPSASWHSLY